MKKFRITLSEKRREPQTHTIFAKDEGEAREWVKRNEGRTFIDDCIEVHPEEEETQE